MVEAITLPNKITLNREIRIIPPKVEIGIIILFTLFMHGILLSAVSTEGSTAVLMYLSGTLLGFVTVYLLLKFGEEIRNRVPILMIIMGMIIVFFVVSYQLLNQSVLNGLLGFVPSFLLIFSKITPLSITYTVEEVNGTISLQKHTNYLIGSSTIRREISNNTKLRLEVEPNGISYMFNRKNPQHVLVFDDLQETVDPIEFAPLSLRGLPLLSKVVAIFGEKLLITTNEVGRTTGGLLGSLEPKIGKVDLRIQELDIQENIDEEIKGLQNSSLERIIYPSKAQLAIHLIFGIGYISIVSILTVILSLLVYYSFIEGEFLLSVLFGMMAVVILILLGIVAKQFLTQPVAMLFGTLKLETNEEEILVYHQLFNMKSHIYRIPKNLKPYISDINGVYSIVCRDSYNEYYRLPLGIESS